MAQTHFDLVLRMFQAQMEAHSLENPSILRQASSADVENQPSAPHSRVGAVRLRFMYVPRSFRILEKLYQNSLKGPRCIFLNLEA